MCFSYFSANLSEIRSNFSSFIKDVGSTSTAVFPDTNISSYLIEKSTNRLAKFNMEYEIAMEFLKPDNESLNGRLRKSYIIHLYWLGNRLPYGIRYNMQCMFVIL